MADDIERDRASLLAPRTGMRASARTRLGHPARARLQRLSPNAFVPMRIISFNANGIRSAANKGFLEWLKTQNADVVCLQETKAQEDQLTDPMFRPAGHHCFYRDATTKKGYSGVAIYAKREPDKVLTKLGWDAFDEEGRYIEARFGNPS